MFVVPLKDSDKQFAPEVRLHIYKHSKREGM